jgi:transposase
MIGTKARIFQPIVNVSLEDLVPADHFYRQVEHSLDLSFVRDLLRNLYSAFGRPWIDPVVLFKLQLVMFFEGIRSERQLEPVGADRLSLRWYLGYDLNQALRDHSSMTRIRDRYGITIFRQFFEAIVERSHHHGLIWGKQLSADASLVEANADRDNMLPRFALEAHLRQLFGQAYQPPGTGQASMPAAETVIPPATGTTEPVELPVLQIGADLPPQRQAKLLAHQQAQYDWYAHTGEPDRSIKRGGYQRSSDLWVSLTDPDAVLMRQHNHGVENALSRPLSAGRRQGRHHRGGAGHGCRCDRDHAVSGYDLASLFPLAVAATQCDG